MHLVARKKVPLSTKDRLLEAAAHAFAKDGFEGATTRRIAHDAGVNEVTLFRLFQTKHKLQTAVLRRVLEQQAELLATQPRSDPSSGLRAELLRIARNYRAALQQNISLVRTLIGEIHRCREQEKQVLHGILDPLRMELLATLEAARQAGFIRAEIDLQIAVSMLPSMILIDTLRRNMDPRHAPAYSTGDHLAACLETFVRGVAA